MSNAADATIFAPMLVVLFMGARMRELLMDPVNGTPQKWVELFFHVYSCGACKVLISTAVTLLLSGTTENDDVEQR